MTNDKVTREDCLNIIREIYIKEKRLTKKSDFSQLQVSAIKSFFGPWPRALEAAGVKEVRSEDRIVKTKQKRIIAKRKRNILRKEMNNKKESD